MNGVVRLLRDNRAATAVEFALTVPLMLMLIFGMIDAGRFFWDVNRAEKATQYGARYAIVTDVMPSAIINENYVGRTYCENDTDASADVCTAGDLFYDTNTMGKLTCTVTGCTCAQGATCPNNASIDATAFGHLVARMKQAYPGLKDSDVQVTFRGSGLGFAGDPNGMDVIPLITVELPDLHFRPILTFNVVNIRLPTFATTLTAESAAGVQSN